MSHHTTGRKDSKEDSTSVPSARPTQHSQDFPPSGTIFDSPSRSFSAYAEQTAPKSTPRYLYRRGLVTESTPPPVRFYSDATETAALSLNRPPMSSSEASSQHHGCVPPRSPARLPHDLEQVNRPLPQSTPEPLYPSIQVPEDLLHSPQAAQAALQRMFGRRLEQNQAMRVSFHGPSQSQIFEEELEESFERLPELKSARPSSMNGVPESGYFGPEGVLRPLPPLPNPPKQGMVRKSPDAKPK